MSATLLVVDDEPLIREVLMMELEYNGYRVLEAPSGNSAIELLRIQDVDLIISDLRMPDGDGFHIIEALKGSPQNSPPVLLMTGLLDLDARDVQERGAQGLISKPFDLGDVMAQVRNVLKGPSPT